MWGETEGKFREDKVGHKRSVERSKEWIRQKLCMQRYGVTGRVKNLKQLLILIAEGARIESVQKWRQDLRVEREALTRPWRA